jgi:hypothetical protein
MVETHLSFDQIRSAAHDLAGERRKARKDYETHARLASEAEREYRKQLAIAFTSHRSKEKGVGESEILANADAAEQKHTRDLEQAQAKAALLRIDELERDGAFLRHLGSWSQELETVG